MNRRAHAPVLSSLLLVFASCATTPAPVADSAPSQPPASAVSAAPDATTTPSAATPSVATPSAPVSAAAAGEDLVDHEGDSPQTAVIVPADAPEDGVPFENNWIYDRYGRFRRNGGGVGSLDERHYSVVEIELPNGDTKKVFFDVTDLWNAWKPPQK